LIGDPKQALDVFDFEPVVKTNPSCENATKPMATRHP